MSWRTYTLWNDYHSQVNKYVHSSQTYLAVCVPRTLRITGLHFFEVSDWKIIVFLWWCHGSLISHVPWSPHCCLCIWRRRCLLQSSLPGFGGEEPSVSPARDSEALSDLFGEFTCSPFLVPSLGGILQIVHFSWFCKARPSANSLLFVFLRVVLNAQGSVLSPSPAAFCPCAPATCESSHLPFSGHTGNQAQGGRVWARGKWSVRGAWGPDQESACEAHVASCWGAFWWIHKAISRIHAPLKPSERPVCSPSSSPSQSCAAHLGVPGGLGKKWVSPTAFCTAVGSQVLTQHSLSPMKAIKDLEGLSCHWAVLPWGRDERLRLNWSSYPLQCVYSQIFFLHRCPRSSPLSPQAFTKVLSSTGDCQSHCSWGDTVENSCSAILLISLSCFSCSN